MSSTADNVQRSPTEATAPTPGYQGPQQEVTERQSPAEEIEEPVAASAPTQPEEVNESTFEETNDKTDDESGMAVPKEVSAKLGMSRLPRVYFLLRFLCAPHESGLLRPATFSVCQGAEKSTAREACRGVKSLL